MGVYSYIHILGAGQFPIQMPTRQLSGLFMAGRIMQIEYLPRVHQPVWIQRCLDRLHDLQRLFAHFVCYELLLSQPNAVFSLYPLATAPRCRGRGADCACPFHLQCSSDHVVHALAHWPALSVSIEQDCLVEVAVANVAQHAAKQP